MSTTPEEKEKKKVVRNTEEEGQALTVRFKTPEKISEFIIAISTLGSAIILLFTLLWNQEKSRNEALVEKEYLEQINMLNEEVTNSNVQMNNIKNILGWYIQINEIKSISASLKATSRGQVNIKAGKDSLILPALAWENEDKRPQLAIEIEFNESSYFPEEIEATITCEVFQDDYVVRESTSIGIISGMFLTEKVDDLISRIKSKHGSLFESQQIRLSISCSTNQINPVTKTSKRIYLKTDYHVE